MDYVVIPINDEMHWYVAIIISPALAVVSDRTENIDEARKRGATRPNPETYIVVLDSLPDPMDVKRKCVIDILRDYLECELEDKRGRDGVLERTRIGSLYPRAVPQQENYVDCGLYLLLFVESFLLEPPIGQKLNQNAKWSEWYPSFLHRIKFMRDKILMRLKGQCSKEIWELLKVYEVAQGRGVNVETDMAVIDRARRPRRHSENRGSEQHPRLRKRIHSEPPDPKNCAPPAPRSSVGT
uniref:ULP_PROTEASE domain-containing protein n=1 Tax=Heterorhabditis bacteriophora TaxID=37862 RepID=A0A1I7WZD0_HETBA